MTALADEVKPEDLFHTLEVLISDGSKELALREQQFRDLWARATPEVKRARDASGNTVLHLMVVYGFEKLALDILKELPELARCATKTTGEYPIHLAVSSQAVETAKALFSIENTPHFKNHKQQTAIHYAARLGSQDMVALCSENAR